MHEVRGTSNFGTNSAGNFADRYKYRFRRGLVFSKFLHRLSEEKKREGQGSQRRENLEKMADLKSNMESIREWIVDHKLRTVGCLWLSGITGSVAYNWSRPGMKTSVKIIHARLHAQALTLAALAGAAAVEYFDHRSGAKTERYAKQFLPLDAHNSVKD